MIRNLGGCRAKQQHLQWKVGLIMFVAICMSMISNMQFIVQMSKSSIGDALFSGAPIVVGDNDDDDALQTADLISVVDHLKHKPFPHGTFFFGKDNHQTNIPQNELIDPTSSWTSLQRTLLDDSEINIEEEKKRCASYNWELPHYNNETKPLQRRRLFCGAMIANDSKEVLQAISTEAYNIFHTVEFIESNYTPNLSPRNWTYFGSKDASKRLHMIQQLFGRDTKVSVDYYVPLLENVRDVPPMSIEDFHREGFSHRWKMNGMRPDDVGIVIDPDEMITRDFLRALQVCDVPQFRQDEQDCKAPKIIASTLIFESSPECAWKDRRGFHPDAVLGKCIDQIGSTVMHPPTKYNYWQNHGSRLDGYGHGGNYSLYQAEQGHHDKYPLWQSHHIRLGTGGQQISKNDKSPTAYHFHNMFSSADQIRLKYSTYGHANFVFNQQLLDRPLSERTDEDTQLALACARGNYTSGPNRESSFESISSSVKPIYYLNEEVRHARHSVWQDIIRKDDNIFSGGSST